MGGGDVRLHACAGAAVTSLGLAMATWFSRPGRAVGVTVTLYVLVTVGWFFLMLVLFRAPGSWWEWLARSCGLPR